MVTMVKRRKCANATIFLFSINLYIFYTIILRFSELYYLFSCILNKLLVKSKSLVNNV
jgi:hypothetical protein